MPREIRSSPPIVHQGTTPYIILIVVALGLLLFQSLSSCNPGTPTLAEITETPVSSTLTGVTETTIAPTQSAIIVYFTDPSRSSGGPDEAVVKAIDAAKSSLDMAMYNLSLDNVCQAMIRAKQRGVKVRLVTESNSLDGGCYDDLKDAGIPVLGDRREGTMHDKFFVIDASQVWTGSLNLTYTGTYQDNNDMVRIDSAQVAQDYTNEFNEMFENDQFGPESVADTPHPQITLNGDLLEVYFSPDDGVSARLKQLLKGATSSIDFLAYSFTLDSLADVILARSRAGVAVRGVFDDTQVETNGSASEFSTLQDAGLDVRLDANADGLMHHKIIIIDRQTVIFGSYNFSRNADQTNDENVIVLHSPALAEQFLAEFEKIYNAAR